MRRITVSVDDETYANAKLRAEQLGVSMSALVREYLREIAGGESTFDRLAREEAEIRKRIRGFSASDNMGRDQLYE